MAPDDPDEYDLFVSYARADNTGGWVDGYVDALADEHRAFTGGRELPYFLDPASIPNFAHWETRIVHRGLARSRLFLAFVSPNYLASDVCRMEWRRWIDLEIARHILSSGSAPVYIVEVPALFGKPMPAEHDVARQVANLCGLPGPHDRFTADVVPIVREVRRRQLDAVAPFYAQGVDALRHADLRAKLAALAATLDERLTDARRAAASVSIVPPYNTKFTGRLDEFVELRRRLVDDRAGVIAGVHGLGGIGKTELAFTYAHAFAGVYPGGRFYVRCEHATDLRTPALQLGDHPAFHARIADAERKTDAAHFAAIVRVLRERIAKLGNLLLVLDNVTDARLLSPTETDALPLAGGRLHLLATTRLAAFAGGTA